MDRPDRFPGLRDRPNAPIEVHVRVHPGLAAKGVTVAFPIEGSRKCFAVHDDEDGRALLARIGERVDALNAGRGDGEP